MTRDLQIKKEKDLLIYNCLALLAVGMIGFIVALFDLPLVVLFISFIGLFGGVHVYLEDVYHKLEQVETLLDAEIKIETDLSFLLVNLALELQKGNSINLYYDKYKNIYQAITNNDLIEGKTIYEVLENLN